MLSGQGVLIEKEWNSDSAELIWGQFWPIICYHDGDCWWWNVEIVPISGPPRTGYNDLRGNGHDTGVGQAAPDLMGKTTASSVHSKQLDETGLLVGTDSCEMHSMLFERHNVGDHEGAFVGGEKRAMLYRPRYNLPHFSLQVQLNVGYQLQANNRQSETYRENMEELKGGNQTKKFLKALYATYGEWNIYNSRYFRPSIRNLTNGSVSSREHHCDQCSSNLTRSCYEKLHHAYCSEWETRERGGKRVRERCGERFAIRSGGCGEHSRVKGYNSCLYRLAEGLDVKLSEFDDPINRDHDQGAENNDLEDNLQDELTELNELAESLIEKEGFLPVNFYDSYWKHKDRQQEYAKKDKKGAAENSLETTEEKYSASTRGYDGILKNGSYKANKLYRQPMKRIDLRKVALMEVGRTASQPPVVKDKLTAKEKVAEWWANCEQQKQ
ncbi:predicted protein [Plenodomus lingam JN3]|uniref:Predicted protein n=1 Tax=Leptosphaeria maculans (strain JN3 / isolate v23.1.3 / race Av1-4-5-6-7-8) TaxID=985895 RepID=E5A2Q2_LEPMJ|nr:predicted protein [Plenodomus lingam JN3]CBX97848.1 predicted protein [Plenodomus lingam JN3]